MLTLLLIVLIVLAFSGSFYNNGAYRGPGIGLGTILLIVLLWVLFTGGGGVGVHP